MQSLFGGDGDFADSIDLPRERRLIDGLGEAASRGLLRSAHDVAEGGLAVALAEACFNPDQTVGRWKSRPTRESVANLFGEGPSTVILSADPEPLAALQEIFARIGLAGYRPRDRRTVLPHRPRPRRWWLHYQRRRQPICCGFTKTRCRGDSASDERTMSIRPQCRSCLCSVPQSSSSRKGPDACRLKLMATNRSLTPSMTNAAFSAFLAIRKLPISFILASMRYSIEGKSRLESSHRMASR